MRVIAGVIAGTISIIVLYALPATYYGLSLMFASRPSSAPSHPEIALFIIAAIAAFLGGIFTQLISRQSLVVPAINGLLAAACFFVNLLAELKYNDNRDSTPYDATTAITVVIFILFASLGGWLIWKNQKRKVT